MLPTCMGLHCLLGARLNGVQLQQRAQQGPRCGGPLPALPQRTGHPCALAQLAMPAGLHGGLPAGHAGCGAA